MGSDRQARETAQLVLAKLTDCELRNDSLGFGDFLRAQVARLPGPASDALDTFRVLHEHLSSRALQHAEAEFTEAVLSELFPVIVPFLKVQNVQLKALSMSMLAFIMEMTSPRETVTMIAECLSRAGYGKRTLPNPGPQHLHQMTLLQLDAAVSVSHACLLHPAQHMNPWHHSHMLRVEGGGGGGHG